MLERKAGSAEGASEAISRVAGLLGTVAPSPQDEQLAGFALCYRGETPEVVSKYLDWKDFERFASSIMRAKGFRVREDVHLRGPRAQIDVFGISDLVSVAVDCKHWKRPPGHQALVDLVEAQKGRARRLHDSLDEVGPIAAVILVLVDPGERFVSGGAVVPIFAFADFLDNLAAHSAYAELV